MWSDSMHTLMWKLAFLLAFILTVCFSAQAQHNPGTFTATGSLTTARGHDSATLLNNGQVLITGGASSIGFLSSAELYNPEIGTFTATGSMATARFLNTATLLNNGEVLITGGVGNYDGPDYLSSAELYNPATGTFTATGSLITARDSHT